MATIAVSFQVLPGGLPDKATTYAAVDAAIAVVAASGLTYLVNPMETTIEGEYDTVMAVIKRAWRSRVPTGRPPATSAAVGMGTRTPNKTNADTAATAAGATYVAANRWGDHRSIV